MKTHGAYKKYREDLIFWEKALTDDSLVVKSTAEEMLKFLESEHYADMRKRIKDERYWSLYAFRERIDELAGNHWEMARTFNDPAIYDWLGRKEHKAYIQALAEFPDIVTFVPACSCRGCMK